MKWRVRIVILVFFFGWTMAAWVWRDGIGIRVSKWRGGDTTVALVGRVEDQAADAVPHTLEVWNNTVAQVKKEIRLPDPIRARMDNSRALLTVAGVFAETNMLSKERGVCTIEVERIAFACGIDESQRYACTSVFRT